MNNEKKVVIWSKGLTKETDPRIRRMAEKISKARKGCTPWNKGLTKETDERVRRNGEAISRAWQKNLKQVDL